MIIKSFLVRPSTLPLLVGREMHESVYSPICMCLSACVKGETIGLVNGDKAISP